jgi:hypothetical protein
LITSVKFLKENVKILLNCSYKQYDEFGVRILLCWKLSLFNKLQVLNGFCMAARKMYFLEILNHVWWTQKGGKKMRNIPFYAPSKSWRGAYHVLNVLEFQHNSFFPLSLLALPPSSTPHLNHGVEHTIHQPKRCSACDQICIAFSGYFFPIGMAGTVV